MQETSLPEMPMPEAEIQAGGSPPAMHGDAGFRRLALGERADPLSDTSLLASLREHQDQPVEIDASRLRHPNTPLLELLIVASHAWKQRSLPFQITGLSAPHLQMVCWLGLTPHLGIGPAPGSDASPLTPAQ